ncbi:MULTISPECIES: ISL3 family transposase [unclassified Streptomyces]|uniref:ISL3 family transposase n=1 Tax=unclassified Streptomyces TaxID=2593676 RepID=UPI000DAD11FC|nr:MULTISPECIES: ISL3 family transposase [unclassified Streptomyces]PZT75711.1 ISL3 family transposase [Streptomyces sp. AC1-42W]PZT80336.1 ISL3 family transposase [Streptomyces sp. AC1-42T]
MSLFRIWKRTLTAEHTVVEGVRIDESEQCVVVSVRSDARRRQRCGRCGRAAPWFDAGRGRRRWRDLDHGVMRVFLEADAPRVDCRGHGVTVAAVPWARHGAGHTYAFDQQTAWLAAECSKTATARLMRASWRTVGAVVERFVADRDRTVDRLAGLRRIGIDEISHRKGQKYMTVVVDHDTGRVVWMADRHGKDVLNTFFDALGPERSAKLTHISADGASWIADTLARRAPDAVRVMDPFHVVAWATDALDTERRASWNRARRQADGKDTARALKGSRFALWKNEADLTDRQAAKLTWIAATDPRLHRAWRLKEALRMVFALARTRPTAALKALDRWIGWARRCRIDAFVDLQRRITRHYEAIRAALTTGMSNGLVESTNTKTRLIIRRGFGFHTADAIIALVMLTLAGPRPTLPGRQPATE